MLRQVTTFLTFGLAAFTVILALGRSDGASPIATHKQVRSLTPELDGRKLQLNTFCLGPESKIWMCCSDVQASSDAGAKPGGYVLIMEPTGEVVKHIQLEFAPTAINFASSGEAFLAGGGKIARLDVEGNVRKIVRAPNLLDEAELKRKLDESAAKQIDQMVKTYEEQVKRLDEQLEKLRTQLKPAGDKEPDEAEARVIKRAESRIAVLETQRKSMQDTASQVRASYSTYYSGDASMERVKRATGIAVADKDIFVSLPSTEGFGYALWRMDHELENAVVIKENLGGCCGQLDIQTDGKDVLVAENTAFRVARYSRDGKEVAHFGERMREGDSGWGSCCNPMNIRCCPNDELLTAESSIGHIKRYTKEGKFLGLVGTARIGGGCKHVALAVDNARDWYYIMNQNGGNIAVLVPRSDAPAETPEERDSREAREGLGKKLLGAWQVKSGSSNTQRPGPAEPFDMDQYMVQQFAYVHFHVDGRLETTRPQSTSASTSAAKLDSGGILGAIASAFGKVTNTVTPAAAVQEQLHKWEAVRQTADALEMVTVNQGVRGYGATIQFIDDNTLTAKWYYDSPSANDKAITYERIPGVCCSSDKPCATCVGNCPDSEKPVATSK